MPVHPHRADAQVDEERAVTRSGAAHVIATEEQDVVAEVIRITNGNGARVVFDPVVGPTFSKLILALAH
jgi:NADPH:quinone reductase-like Zn-dependent oxidoreductase